MLTFTKPAALNGSALAQELAAAGFPDARVTDEADGTIAVRGPSEADRDAVQAVIDAHVPPSPSDPQGEFDAALAAAAAKGTVEEKVDALLAALQGDGLPGKAAARGKA